MSIAIPELFITFGKGPGNNTILLASKTSPTAIRGQFYGVAAAVGKLGAFIGTWGACGRFRHSDNGWF